MKECEENEGAERQKKRAEHWELDAGYGKMEY